MSWTVLRSTLPPFELIPSPHIMDSLKIKKTASSSSKAARTESHHRQSSPSQWEFDVFLSFRGPDTRDGFIDYLYEDLMQAQIRTFRDNEGLCIGEEIGGSLMREIEHSNIFIPVFSKGYACSKWCLRELAYMMDHMQEKQVILPVFYDVNPHDVRHQTGPYKEAFDQHMKNGTIHDEEVKNWRNALQRVGNLKGLTLEDDAHRSKGKLKILVLERVSRLLHTPYVKITDKLVGIDNQINKVLTLLCMERNDVRFVGLWGMGGIGKTTLAKAIYNKISVQFDCSSFLHGVRHQFTSNGPSYALLKQLNSDMLKRKGQNFCNVDEGIKETINACRTKKVLIVIDDVDEKEQIEVIAGGVDWFGPGSRIIVTTRDREVLSSSKSNLIYEVRDLDPESSQELLCKHAFMGDQPLGFEELVDRVAYATKGLPLALEVIGSYLRNKEYSSWIATLEMLENRPHDRVREALQISYDALSYCGKQIFLDIACFFIKCSYNDDCHPNMWRSFGLSPEHEIKVLIDRSLIKIDKENRFEMHDQLRDFGRTIVNEENFTISGKRSRLWKIEEGRSVLEDRTGTKTVEGLRAGGLPFYDEQHVLALRKEAFVKLQNLRYLWLGRANLSGNFQGLVQELRWLRWSVVDPKIFPRNLSLINLVYLDLSKSNITEKWGGWSVILQNAKNLKALHLWQCKNLRRTPEFPENTKLEKLCVKGCSDLKGIDASIKNLKSLVLLDVSACFNLEQVPSVLGSLTSLVELYLQFNYKLHGVPLSIGNLKKLQKLSLQCCSRLQNVPGSIGELESLTHLDLSWTENLKVEDLPAKLGSLTSLTQLRLDSKSMPRLPHSLRHLPIDWV